MVDVNLANLARMTVSSSGTGTITLNAAVPGFLTYDLAGCSTAAAGTVVRYAVNDTAASEIAYGTYTSSALSLTRGSSTTGMKSTNSNSPINMSNAAQVFITPNAADFPFLVNTLGTIATTSLNIVLGGTLTYGGVALTAAVTGTGSMVLSASPTFTGTITAAALTLSGVLTYGGVALAAAVSGTGNMVLSAAPTLTGALTYGGVTLAASVTGTGSMVLSAAPTFTGTVTIATLALTTVGAHTISGAITYGGVALSNSVTGTGSMVLSASPTLTGTTTIAALAVTTIGAHTISGAITYGGVALSNSVTGTGSMVLSASPTLTGTLTAAIANFSGAVTVAGDLILNSAGNPALFFTQSGTNRSIIYHDGAALNVNSDATGSVGVQLPNSQNAWFAFSDARLPYKRSAREVTDTLPSLDNFRLYEGTQNGRTELFPKAQEVYSIFPHLVMRGDDDPDYTPSRLDDPRSWLMTYGGFGPIALAYIRKQGREIEELKQRIDTLAA